MQAEAATSNRSVVVAALAEAAQATGADFRYLLGTATRESGLNPSIHADTSSATGLFQFVDQSWLAVVKNFGAKHGLGSFANAITQGRDGHYAAANPADRQAILALRTDPKIAALMEGEYAQASRARLSNSLGREVSGGELYCAHFLGETAACHLIRMSESQPNAPAASAFPAAAEANRRIFYRSDGTPKSAREVYAWATGRQNVTALSSPLVHEPKPIAPSVVPNADHTDSASLMASLSAWVPRHGFFNNEDDEASAPLTPFLMTPGAMDILSSITPVAAEHTAH